MQLGVVEFVSVVAGWCTLAGGYSRIPCSISLACYGVSPHQAVASKAVEGDAVGVVVHTAILGPVGGGLGGWTLGS